MTDCSVNPVGSVLGTVLKGTYHWLLATLIPVDFLQQNRDRWVFQRLATNTSPRNVKSLTTASGARIDLTVQPMCVSTAICNWPARLADFLLLVFYSLGLFPEAYYKNRWRTGKRSEPEPEPEPESDFKLSQLYRCYSPSITPRLSPCGSATSIITYDQAMDVLKHFGNRGNDGSLLSGLAGDGDFV